MKKTNDAVDWSLYLGEQGKGGRREKVGSLKRTGKKIIILWESRLEIFDSPNSQGSWAEASSSPMGYRKLLFSFALVCLKNSSSVLAVSDCGA